MPPTPPGHEIGRTLGVFIYRQAILPGKIMLTPHTRGEDERAVEVGLFRRLPIVAIF